MNETSNPSQALARRWFQKAENDLLNVENNLKAERYASDTVCLRRSSVGSLPVRVGVKRCPIARPFRTRTG